VAAWHAAGQRTAHSSHHAERDIQQRCGAAGQHVRCAAHAPSRQCMHAGTAAPPPPRPAPPHPATAPATQSASRRAKCWLAAAVRFGCGRSTGGPRWALEGLRLPAQLSAMATVTSLARRFAAMASQLVGAESGACDSRRKASRSTGRSGHTGYCVRLARNATPKPERNRR
jgi:hypothetical protein